MTYLLCRNHVMDYDRWREVFDGHAAAHEAAGLRLLNLWRGVEDADNVFFLFEVSDVAAARAFLSDPDAAEAGREAGVLDGVHHFIEDAV